MEQISQDLIMYLNKLIKTIETQSNFNLGNVKVVNKTRIDDILCCIDVNFPNALKLYKKHGQSDKNIHSFDLYENLIANIKNKIPLMGKNNYAVNYNEVLNIVQLLKQSFAEDTAYIEKTYPYFFNENY